MIKPSWLEIVSSERCGFDSIGMWFSGNANGGEGATSYPIRTNFDIPENETCTIVFTFIHSNSCSDQGVCVFNTESTPIWTWGTDSSRIAYQFDCPFPHLDGQSNNGGEQPELLEVGQVYTGRFVYDPSGEGTVTGELFVGSNTTGEPISTISITEKLPSGSYRVGFDADLDEQEMEFGSKSYFTYISVNGRISESGSSSSCSRVCDNNHSPGFSCFTTKACVCTKWRYFPPQCSRANIVAGTCSSIGGAYVPAITVCNQRLF